MARHSPTPGPFRASVVSVTARTHSTIHVICVVSAAGDERRFYLKTLNTGSSDRAERMVEATTEFRVLSELWKRFVPFSDLGVVRAVACLPEDSALITEEFPGQKLDIALAQARLFGSRRELEKLAHLCHLAGRWLRHFQSFTAPSQASRFDIGELFHYCEERLRIIVDGPGSGLDATRSGLVIAHLERLAAYTDESELEISGRQNDYRPDNMLTRDGRLVVLDFTGFTWGPRLYDFMKFWMRLDYYAFGPLAAPDRIDLLKRRFAEGYGGGVNVRSPLAEILHLANILDKMSELTEAPSRRRSRRALEKAWYRHLKYQLDRVLDSP